MQWSEQRRRLRAILSGAECVRPASTFDPLSARAAESLGYELVMLAGSTASLAVLGAPDLALLTSTELAALALRIARATQLPLLVDADHGYGNALNVMRTIEALETSGVAGATIEDTRLPAAFEGGEKSMLISLAEGVGKMRAAVAARRDRAFVVIARTSAPTLSNLDDAALRLAAYEDTGVDALFVAGLKSVAELEHISRRTRLPLILGSLAGELETADLASWRVRVALQGHAPIMAAIEAAYATMKALREGRTPREIGGLASRDRLERLTRSADVDAAARAFLSPNAGAE